MNLLNMQVTGNRLWLRYFLRTVATALCAVSTWECITELDRPQAGAYRINCKKSAREVFTGACSFYLENNFVATASSSW